jgi:tetratricopeptide (TPR) repeat protein
MSLFFLTTHDCSSVKIEFVRWLFNMFFRTIPAALAAWLICSSLPALALSEIEKRWDQTQKEGTNALDTNRYWLAEPLLKGAVIQAGSFGMHDLRLAKSMGELGRLYTVRGRFKDAEPFFEEELQIKRGVLGDEHEAVVPAMGALASFYLNYGDVRKADPLTYEILAIVEGKLQEARPEGASGKMMVKKGVPLEGWAGEASAVARDPLLEWAITCDALGNQYRLHSKYYMAGRLYKAALDTKSTVLGKEHLSLANSYDNLGLLCLDRNECPEAESYFRDALSQTERILPSDSPQVYQRMDKLARCLVKSGKYGEAAQIYQKALESFKGAPSKNGDDARALYALGCIYCDQHRFSDAASVLGRALHLAEEGSGPYSISLVPYLEKYAYTLYHLGRRSETDHLRWRANSISGV